MKRKHRGTKVLHMVNSMSPEVQHYFEIMFNDLKVHHPFFSDALKNAIIDSCEVFSFKRNDILLDYGETCRYCYFCIKGLVTGRYIKDGAEKAKWFFAEHDMIISVKSFFNQVASLDKLVAKEPTICLAIPWKKLETIYEEYPEFNKIGRKLTEYYYELAEERAMWINYDAEGRYHLLFKAYPKLANRISDTDLSSYLGITRQYLSTIRKHRINKYNQIPGQRL
ncbi:MULTISPECIES: Crp/Fnr family transcriptional regulator [unclassified Chitinophaga]|uniref:Crp/Fnr family transcriptional regulator n=1 Tax=unclassified Chitinophaga TaxID=2619133 RepID=UPI00300FB48E